jgi:release factor glutamine methyltransferase
LNILELLKANKNILKNGNIEEYDIESELILMHVLKYSKSELITNLSKTLTNNQIEKNNKIIIKRLSFIPLPYILRHAYFYNSKFYINKSVLIPRQETELIVDICASILNDSSQKSSSKILEIGTGSGAITASLSDKIKSKNFHYIATDIDTKTLKIAKKNILKINENIKLDLLNNNLLNGIIGEYKFIISNPPYLSKNNMNNLQCELKYEPAKALFAGEKGYEVCEKILKQIKDFNIKFENLILEINPLNAKYLMKKTNNLFSNYFSYLIKDYNKKNRFILISSIKMKNKSSDFSYLPN